MRKRYAKEIRAAIISAQRDYDLLVANKLTFISQGSKDVSLTDRAYVRTLKNLLVRNPPPNLGNFINTEHAIIVYTR